MTLDSHSSPSILAVVALYQCALAQSESACSLFAILREHADLAKHFALIVYDNSPQEQTPAMSAGFPTEYVHNAANGGLATAYNFALAHAAAAGFSWLLLLDQDTSLTYEFVVELVEAARALDAEASVAAIVPKLVVNGVIHSPAPAFVAQMRRQFGRRPAAVAASLVGIQQQRLIPYNSGAAVRVSALQATGGFPSEFWLDFLDHAVFHALFSAGYRLYVLGTGLAHNSSYADVCSLPEWRFRNVLVSQALFLTRYGSFVDRLLYRIWLLRHSRSLRRSCKNKRLWKVALWQALLLSTQVGAEKDKR